MMSFRAVLMLLVWITVAAGVGACQSSESEESESVTTDEAARTPTMSTAATDTVTVELQTYWFTTSRDTFVAGQPYHFVLRNQTGIEHEWTVVPRGAQGEDDILFEVEGEALPPDSEQVVTFSFPEPGNYDFACFLEEPDDHYENGMVYPVVAVAP